MDVVVLAGLALVDSLSAGTLVTPIVLLVTWQRPRPGLYFTYLGTIAVTYFGIGLALLFGMQWFSQRISEVSQATWFSWAMFTLGVALAAFGILSPNPKKKTIAEIKAQREQKDGLSRGGVVGMVFLALGMAAAEVATMLPYLAAIGIMQSMNVGLGVRILLLAIYCGIMIAPAVLVGFVFTISAERIFAAFAKALPRLEYETR